MWKNKLLLNDYLGDFMHFETLFFSVEMGLTPNPNPLPKMWKILPFFNPSLLVKSASSLFQICNFREKRNSLKKHALKMVEIA